MSDLFDFGGRHVFVAGGTSGINLGIAKGFARAGAKLSVLSRSQSKVDAAVETLCQLGAEAQGFALDVRDSEAVDDALAAAVMAFGPLDVLISGAAGNFTAPAADITANGFKSVVDIDLLGTFNVVRAAYPHLSKPGGCVVNISAPQAAQPVLMQAHVCAAKAGGNKLTEVLAMEWGPEGIRVNAISPGPIEGTEGMARLAPNEAARQLTAQSVPLKRFGDVTDIANAAMFLCSPLGDYINGAILPVDGGWVLAGASSLGDKLARLQAA